MTPYAIRSSSHWCSQRGSNLKRTTVRIAAICCAFVVVSLLGIRTYGAFEREQESATARADKAEEEAQAADALDREDQQKIDCSTRWLRYQTALLEKQNTELRGGTGHTPIEPSCDGYALPIDRVISMSNESMQAVLDAANAREYARYEREYSTNRELQAKFFALRFWTYLKGSEMKPLQQAMMQKYEDSKRAQKQQSPTR